MFYDEKYKDDEKKRSTGKQQNKERNTKRRPRHFLRGFLLFIVLVAVMLLVCAPVAQKGMSDEDGWLHVLVIGIDSESGEGRTDSMIVVSVSDSGRVLATSLMRDTYINMGDYGKHKLNAAYKLGGEALLKKCVQYAFGIDIAYIAKINLSAFVELVDSLGGIEMDLTEEEALQINSIARSRRANIKDYSPLAQVTKYGSNIHLNGEQALAYSRIRKIDTDYVRTDRQRAVIGKVVAKLKQFNIINWARFAYTATKYVETDMPLHKMLLEGIFVLTKGKQIENHRLPADGTFESGTYDGVWCIRADYDKNKALMQEYLAG